MKHIASPRHQIRTSSGENLLPLSSSHLTRISRPAMSARCLRRLLQAAYDTLIAMHRGEHGLAQDRAITQLGCEISPSASDAPSEDALTWSRREKPPLALDPIGCSAPSVPHRRSPPLSIQRSPLPLGARRPTAVLNIPRLPHVTQPSDGAELDVILTTSLLARLIATQSIFLV